MYDKEAKKTSKSCKVSFTASGFADLSADQIKSATLRKGRVKNSRILHLDLEREIGFFLIMESGEVERSKLVVGLFREVETQNSYFNMALQAKIGKIKS